jgi:hypothetical protein
LIKIRLMAIHGDDPGLESTSQDERLPAWPATKVKDDGLWRQRRQPPQGVPGDIVVSGPLAWQPLV